MLFRKTERKKHSVGAILTVGALAAIGALSITRCGKQMLNNAMCKVKGFFKKENSCTCPTDSND